MKVMIFGDSASGKSTFAKKLGEKLSIKPLHLDQTMEEVGRGNREEIKSIISAEIEKEEWIIDGNAFTKDQDLRIKNADIIFVFDFPRIVTFFNLVKRYSSLKAGRKRRIGATSTKLNLKYFLPYIFVKFPKRKKFAIEMARSIDTKVKIFKDRKEATDYIELDYIST